MILELLMSLRKPIALCSEEENTQESKPQEISMALGLQKYKN